VIQVGQDTVDQHGLSDAGLTDYKDLRSFVEQILNDIAVTHSVDCWNSDLVEFSLLLHHVALELIVPVDEVALVQFDHVLIDSG
jgi:hypothetical protein